ncbi:tumor protein D52 isoform X3 [Rhipicephalus sanguineus]|uniref:tumor protein D52 isoform X3 n=1 Tax=Rhipicephalus sanguineus TaxID=34632 RepID=UPI001895CF85|nr:tumor protein D52 isoform X3 [Rhipicephalus sanguineus]
MDRAGAVTYEEDPYLPDCKAGEEESPAYDPGQDLGQVGATDPTLDDEGRSLLRLAAGEEIEELHHENFFDASADVKTTDATPDSGVHDLSGMDPEEKARQEAALRDELAQVEEEIQSLRTVLAAKVARSQELKRQLGISVWKELKDDMEQGIKNIQDTAAYQKTSATIKTAGEKTTTALGSLSASVSKKLGEMKNSTAFKSVEEKVGSVYTNVKSKVSSRSSSVNSFEDALNSHPSNTSVSATPTTTPITEEKKPLS